MANIEGSSKEIPTHNRKLRSPPRSPHKRIRVPIFSGRSLQGAGGLIRSPPKHSISGWSRMGGPRLIRSSYEERKLPSHRNIINHDPKKKHGIQATLTGVPPPTTSSNEDGLLIQNRDKYRNDSKRIDEIVERDARNTTTVDVFLSFLGADTRNSFVGFLQDALKKERFKIHMHDEKSEELHQISPFLAKTIDEAWLSIIILSENYAHSPLCLNELVTILDCMKKKKKEQIVLPIFYKMDEKNIRHHKYSFDDAMAKHVKMFGKKSKKVQKWRLALTEVQNLDGPFIKIGDKQEVDHTISSIVKIVSNVSIGEKGDRCLKEEHQQKPWRYDVFLSFQGSDTRESFTGYLYHVLCREGFKTLANEEANEIDNKVMVRDTIRKAIEESRILIVVLSENYVSTDNCLQELNLILDCKKRNGQLVFAIYYDVAKVGVDKWSPDLNEAADLSFKIGGKQQCDACIQEVVKWASEKLPCYDVFLSLSKEDQCYFTNFLQTALDMKGFKTFKTDKSSEDGDQSSNSLVTAIEKSRLSIIVLSENYVDSSSCLDELVTIISSMKVMRQLVWPIFLKMDPSDLENSFKKAIERDRVKSNQKQKEHDKVHEWRSAIYEAAKLVPPQQLESWHLKYGDEYEMIEEIVKKAIEI